MSFLSGLRASTSSSSSSSSSAFLVPARRPLAPPLVACGVAISRRHASTPAEKQAELIKRRHDKLRAQGVDIDKMIHEQQTPIPPDAVVEPKAQLAWFMPWKKYNGRPTYLWNRFVRFLSHRHMLASDTSELWKLDRKSFPLSVRVQTVSLRAELKDVYDRYYQAQARGDSKEVAQLARDQCLRSAERVLRADRKMKWELLPRTRQEKLWEDHDFRKNDQPKFMWARVQATSEMTVAQVCLRFDTKQKLTIFNPKSPKDLSKSTERIERVSENVLFEKRAPSKYGWQLRMKLDESKPEFLKTDEEKKADQRKQSDMMKALAEQDRKARASMV